MIALAGDTSGIDHAIEIVTFRHTQGIGIKLGTAIHIGEVAG
jgi:hypothetical protein